ncbi:MAG: prolyl oligopeptidase family serine peptidase [Gemmatimonadales bacterium]
MSRALALLIGALLAPAALAGQQPRQPLTIGGFLALKTVSDPQISPDGSRVAYTVTTASLEADRNVSRVFVTDLDRNITQEIPGGGGSDRSPRWDPEGKAVLFVSTRDTTPQIWRFQVDSGTMLRLTNLDRSLGDFVLSPNGKELVFTADVPWPAQQEVDLRSAPWPTSARIWTDLFYRHWNEWRAGTRQHVFRLVLATGETTNLTPFDRDVPTLALGGADLAYSAPGTELAVVYNPDPSVATSTNNDIFVMSPDGTGRQPVTSNPANDHSPAYSFDSRYLAYLAMSVPGFEADRQQIWLYERATGRRTSLTPDWDLSVTAIAWTRDSRAIIAQVEERGEVVLYRIDVPGGRRQRILGGGVNSDVRTAARADRMVFLRQTAARPPEVYVAGTDGSDPRQVSAVNSQALEGLALTAAEPFAYVGALDDSVHGWIIRPPGFDPARQYPVIYLIHGGPQGAWLNSWHPRWNYAMFAARGYVVAAVNFHGSTGYGQTFTNSISRHWGDYPYDDLMKGVDYLASLPYVDSTRIAAAGASYGGYMIYWMAGHTNRFRTLVAHDGIFNVMSMVGTTEELWFPIHEFGGSQLAIAARAIMEKWSPANYASNWTTPMLIIHGQDDYRVDLSEGLQAFTALRLRGIPGKFLYFPDEGHFVLKPRNRRLWWGTVLDWIDDRTRN